MAVTCRDIMELETCRRLKLIGGASGIGRYVTWPYIKNMDTISEWIHGGELVFVIGSREDISEKGLLALMEEADRSKIAGVVLLIGGDYIKAVPHSVVRFANERGLPLFKMPFVLKLIDITRDISRYIMEDQLRDKECDASPEQTVLELFMQGRTRDEVLTYCFRRLQPLEEADKIRGSEYVKTLKFYLESGNDLMHAAEKMYIHRNTMINRMKKINSLLQLDMNDTKVRNEYSNVFQVLEYYGMSVGT